jgi:membrane protein implicated in regulation of membrane protease activity
MEPYIMPIVWGAVLVVSLIVEEQTAELVDVWFIPGALTSLLLSLVGVDEWIQWLVFLVVSAVLLVLAFTVFRKRFLKNHGKEKTDIDLLVGQTAKVIERIDNADMTGAVKVGGKEWSARMADDCETAEVGEFVEIESVSGVKLICRWK